MSAVYFIFIDFFAVKVDGSSQKIGRYVILSLLQSSKKYCLYFPKGALKGHVIEKYSVTSLVECGLKCVSLLPDCKSLNYVTIYPSKLHVCEINNSSKSHTLKDNFFREPNSEYFEPISEENLHGKQDDGQDKTQVFYNEVHFRFHLSGEANEWHHNRVLMITQ